MIRDPLKDPLPVRWATSDKDEHPSYPKVNWLVLVTFGSLLAGLVVEAMR